MKKIIIFFSSIFFVCVLFSCLDNVFWGKNIKSFRFDIHNISGNSNGNVANRAFVTKQGEWIFCQNSFNIFALNSNSGKKVNLTYKSGNNLNVTGEFLFFTRRGGLGGFDSADLYCFDLSKSKLSKINGIIPKNMIAYDGWLYYTNSTSSPPNCLYKAKYDGTEVKRLTDFSISEFNIIGNRVYTSTNDIKVLTLDGDIIYKVDFEGELKELAKRNIIFYDNNMYFITGYQKNYGIAKLNIDTLQYTQIINEPCVNFNITDEWIYFVKEKDQKLYKVKVCGEDEKQVGNVVIGRTGINIIDEWIYYYQDNALHRIKLDGSISEKI